MKAFSAFSEKFSCVTLEINVRYHAFSVKQRMKNHLLCDSISTANSRNSKTHVYSKNNLGDMIVHM